MLQFIFIEAPSHLHLFAHLTLHACDASKDQVATEGHRVPLHATPLFSDIALLHHCIIAILLLLLVAL